MRFTPVVVATALAGVASARVSILTETEELTITSCGPEVTSCPGRTTTTPVVVPTTTPEPVTTPEYTTTPIETPTTTPVETPSTPVETPVTTPVYTPTTTPEPTTTETPTPTISVIQYSSCVPTIVESTITVTPGVAPTASNGETIGVSPLGTGTASASGSLPT